MESCAHPQQQRVSVQFSCAFDSLKTGWTFRPSADVLTAVYAWLVVSRKYKTYFLFCSRPQYACVGLTTQGNILQLQLCTLLIYLLIYSRHQLQLWLTRYRAAKRYAPR